MLKKISPSVLEMLRLRGAYVPSMQVFPYTLVTVSQTERERAGAGRGALLPCDGD